MAHGPLLILALVSAFAMRGFAAPSEKLVPIGVPAPRISIRSVDLGRTAPTQTMHLAVSMPFGDAVAARQYADAVSNPKSPYYRQFLTPEEVGQRFGPDSTQVEKITSYLKGFGMNVKLVAKNRLSVLADATVAQAEAAFHTQIRSYRAVDPNALPKPNYLAYTDTPTVPADIASLIIDVSGLETYTQPKPRATQLMPPQTRALYNMAPIYNAGNRGEGRTIGISNWDGFRLSYLPTFYSNPYWTLPAPAGGVGSNVTVVKVDGGSGAGTNSGEGDLDIQAVLAVAPKCNLVIYDGGAGLISVLTQEANDNIADVITESYGWSINSTTAVAANNIHVSMTLQGITYMCASGDNGTTLTPYSYPDYDPEVLMVGGTTTDIDSNGKRVSEKGWSGSGGGWVVNSYTFNTLPSWQKGNNVPTTINRRLVPDISLNADPNTGFWIIYLNAYYLFGGTSASSPTYAGGIAIAQQKLIANGALTASGGKYRLGRLQDLIYSLNGKPSVFYDVTSGANGSLPDGSASTATVGWDFVTGWGAMDFDAFVSTYPTGPSVATLTLNPTSVTGGTSSTATVTLTGAAPASGTVVTLTSSSASATVPATITVPSGSSSKTFTVTTLPVAATASVQIGAAKGSDTPVQTSLSIQTPTHALSMATTIVCAGETWPVQVTLNGPAPTGGLTLALAASSSAVTVPVSVTVAAGQTTGSFNLLANSVASATSVTLTASRSGVANATLSLTANPTRKITLALSPNPVIGGSAVTGTVTITPAAPTGGLSLAVISGNAVAQVPATVVVPAGQTSKTFSIQTSAVSVATPTTIRASGVSSAGTNVLTVNPPSVSAVTLNPTTIIAGGKSTATVTLTGPAPSSWLKVDLTSSATSVATVPASVSVAPGQTSATFVVTGGNVTTSSTSTIGLSLRGVAVGSTSITVTPSKINRIAFPSYSIVGGQSMTATLSLTGPAPVGGVVVTLVSGVPSVLTLPATVTVPAGQLSVAFTVGTVRVTADKAVFVQATLNGATVGYNLKVTTVAPTLSLSSATVVAGQSVTGTVTLSAPLSVGIAVTLTSSNTSAATVPASVYFAAGSTTATFTIRSLAGGTGTTTTITAVVYGKSSAQVLTVN